MPGTTVMVLVVSDAWQGRDAVHPDRIRVALHASVARKSAGDAE